MFRFLKTNWLVLTIFTLVLAYAIAKLGIKPRHDDFGRTSSLAACQIFAAKNEKIRYGANKKLTPQLEDLIMSVFDCESQLMQKMGAAVVRDANTPTQITARWKKEELEGIKARFWTQLQRNHPYLKLPAAYSADRYGLLLAKTLPQLLASYRVFAKPAYLPIYDVGGAINLAEPIVNFYHVESVRSENVRQWGKQLRRDIVYIDGPLEIRGKRLNFNQFALTSGQTFYQNVIIYRSQLNQTLILGGGMTEEQLRELVEQVSKIPDALFWQKLSESQTETAQREEALKILAAKLTVQLETPKLTLTEVEQTVVAHETRHLLDQMDPFYRKTYGYKPTWNAQEDIRRQTNVTVHEEIDGLLGQLRYGNRKVQSLVPLISGAQPGITQDYGHDKAARWVLDEMLKKLAARPQAYGATFDPSRKVSPESQALMALPYLKDAAINQLAEEIFAEHRQRFTEDLADEAMAAMGMH